MDDRQDIRFAVVLNGGVSLAVWMSGVTAELNRMVAASRDGATRGRGYRALLDLLHATATVDVIAGTSAGGINGGFLAVGVGVGGSLDGLGRLWADKGGLAQLLRDPLEAEPASLLRGDKYFLPALESAFDDLWKGAQADRENVPPEKSSVDLFLTGTLYAGRRTRFADDMGANIDEIDHDALFHFGNDGACPAGDLRHRETMAKLAAASRCTSSFPGAFEPHFIGVRDHRIVDDRDARWWDTDAGPATFEQSQYVVDGGILLNKPIRPALDAIYRKSAQREVRRVLAYVAPLPGQRDDPAGGGRSPVPPAHEVVMNVLTRLQATQSVARELAEIRRTNDAVRNQRATRARLVAAMTRQAANLACDPAVWEGYQQERRRIAAGLIADLIIGGGTGDSTRWSAQELTDAIRRLPADTLSFVPADPDPARALTRVDGDWTWGQTTVERLGAIALDVLKRAMATVPVSDPALRAAIAGHRTALYDVLERIWANRRELNAYWRDVGKSWPTRDRGTEALDRWIVGLLARWTDEARRDVQYRQARDIAEVLAVAGPDLLAISAPADAELTALVDYLLRGPALADTQDAGAPAVLRRALMLDIVHLALAGTLDQPEQEVELVQVSSLDSSLLTAVQAYHFGAFYRRSWRVNDWLRGRIDGTTRVCQILLSPARLRQLGHTTETAMSALKAVVTGEPGSPEYDFLSARWADGEPALRAELAYLDSGQKPPAGLPRCADQVALRVQLEFVGDELAWLADALRRDEPAAAWLRDYESSMSTDSVPAPATTVRLLSAAEMIGRQRLADEVGTDELVKLTSQIGVVAANLLAAVPRTRTVRAILRALRGYALILWTSVSLATSRGRFGPRTVALAVTLGSAAIGISLFAPNVPMFVVLLGALLVLTGLATGALLTPRGRPIGRRLVLPALMVLVALSAVAWNHREALHPDLLFKSGVVVALVLLGSYLGRVRPEREQTGKKASS
ncbi:patatin-like protein [Actinoplanes sp. NPDC024001]|uniref:patatin-like protein n=1 Tax=Actinoplanes sp. NPDC024001 TaxID=3154598 RepID=UPI0033DB1420